MQLKNQDSDEDDKEEPPTDFVSPQTQKYQKVTKEFDETFSGGKNSAAAAAQVLFASSSSLPLPSHFCLLTLRY